MKNIFKISIIAFLFSLASCTNDKVAFASANGLVARVDAGVTSPTVLLPSNDANEFTKLNWDLADNRTPSISTYSIIISDKDADPEFKNPVEYKGAGIVVTTTTRNATLKNTELNVLMNKLKSFKCSEMNLEIRVKSKLGIDDASAFFQYSNPINVKVTAYSISKPVLAVVLNGATASNSAVILASNFQSNTDYEGYIYLQAGSYKLYKPNPCGDFVGATIFGGSSDNLSVGGPDLVIAASGYYLVTANLLTNKYSIKEYTSIALNGKATRGGSVFVSKYVPLNYDTTTKKWSGLVDLLDGQLFKFAAVKWTGALTTSALPNMPQPAYINTSTVTSFLGKIVAVENGLVPVTNTTGDLTVPGAVSTTLFTKYLITVDVSNPHNYTYLLTPQ